MISKAQRETIEALKKLVAESKPRKRQIKVDILIDTNNEVAESVRERMREAYAVMKAAYEECYQAAKVAGQKHLEISPNEAVDVLFCMKQTIEFATDLIKQFNRIAQAIKNSVVEQHEMQPDQGIILGTLAKGACSRKERVQIPSFSNDPVTYNLIYDWLGIAEDLRDRGKELYAMPPEGHVLTDEDDKSEFRTKVVEIDYKGFNDLITKYRNAGYVLPDFIQKCLIAPEAYVTLYKTEDIL
jgi:hypothetical protein